MDLAKIDFSKTTIFGDIHYGLKNNSREHNANCENFIKWMIQESSAAGIKTCIFLGDYHHVRSAINISTLNYSVSGLRLLSEGFDNVIFLIGNHDLFYRDKYEIHSIPFVEQFTNIHLIDKITESKQVSFVPWLVSDDWKKVHKIKSPYMFGHFELPSFKMNAVVEMPDNGTLNKSHFPNQKQIFSGHFHKRQNQDKFWYIGNCFPHDFSDAWDDERGFMIWEPGKDPIFKNYPNAPKYRTLSLSKVLSNPFAYIDSNTYAKITIDVDINYEEVNFIKEMFETELQAKEIRLINNRIDDLEVDSNAAINFESVDSIVISHLQSIDSNIIDKQHLVSIYQGITV